MSSRIPIRCRAVTTAGVLIAFLLVPLALPRAGEAGELFPGYPEIVRTQAERVLAIAGPGKEEALAKEVRLLRIRMHAMGILSVNDLPDLLFERAVREKWKKEATPILRAVREVSALSVPMWAWLVKEDILRLDLADLFQDVEGLSGSLRRFGPALMGFAAWAISFLSAAGCWFVAWSSICLFLRARPSLEGDVQRFLKIPFGEFLAPVFVVLLFLLPILSGLGLAIVASFWMLLSAGYLRRSELAVLTTGVLILAGLLLCGGVIQSLKAFGGGAGGSVWLGGEGNLAIARWEAGVKDPEPFSGDTLSWMKRFAKARAEMQSGHAVEAEKMWTSLAQEGRGLPEVLNNRGIARAQQGKIAEALSDFEAAFTMRPNDGSALWNAYQVHLQVFNLERARRIQPEAWERIQKMAPYQFRPYEMEQGEWVASALPVSEIWKVVFHLRGGWVRGVGASDIFRMFFHPLSVQGALVFLCAVWLSAGIWKLLSLKVWINNTCRACGSHALIVGSREASDICTPCRVKIGGGIRAGEERDRRVQSIVMHRRYVKASSVLVPGSGALWSGKEIRTLVYGVFLSLALAGVSLSLAGERTGRALVSELEATLAIWAVLLAGGLWAGGTLWGIRSFSVLQRRHNIAGERG
ncbi:MAG: hypothetical protein HZA60_09955 [Deltaproteobacteria bacterium]|nr:hypothetical protein [Deltaproteobacteria bacterium]